jgi:formylglycine-generating enzyme required for sulfatase activity
VRCRWPAYAPLGNEETIENELIEVPDGVVELGKPSDFPSYGWDNEYGRRHVTVPAFRASKYLITNKCVVHDATRVTTRHDTTRHDTTRHDTTRHDTTRHDTTRHDARNS